MRPPMTISPIRNWSLDLSPVRCGIRSPVVSPIDKFRGLSTKTVAQSSLETIEIPQACVDAVPG
jgi:hypothetical protein